MENIELQRELYRFLPRVSKYISYDVTDQNIDKFWLDLYKIDRYKSVLYKMSPSEFRFDTIQYDKEGAIRQLKYLEGIIQKKIFDYYKEN